MDYTQKYPRLKECALYVKENLKILSILGFIFFIIALLLGVIWIFDSSNNKLEPIMATTGAFSTIFFGLPQLAEFILPTRKPIRHMSYDELILFIENTNPRNDWHTVYKTLIEESFLKEDPRLRITTRLNEDGICNDDFVEDWANKHPDPKAKSYYYDISFDGNFIHRITLVTVDGARATLPIPERHTMQVKKLDYKIAQIFDQLNTLEEYMKRSGLTI